MELRLPETVTPPELLVPPAGREANSGLEAELLIGKMLADAGWKVVYYSQRRGYGFDLWALRNSVAYVIEVKSTSALATSVSLTALEMAAAQHHGPNYLLVVVEYGGREGDLIQVIRNPAAVLTFTQRSINEHVVNRAGWLPHAVANLPE